MEDFGTLDYESTASWTSLWRSLEDSSAESLPAVQAWFKRFQKNSVSHGTRDHSCDVLAMNVAFCPCPKNLPEAKLKNNKLISLAEEIQDEYRLLCWYE